MASGDYRAAESGAPEPPSVLAASRFVHRHSTPQTFAVYVNDSLGVETGSASGTATFTMVAGQDSVLQSMIKYYSGNIGPAADPYAYFRYTTPSATGKATQTVNADGSVTIATTTISGYSDSGFVICLGKLGNINNIAANSSAGAYSMNLWFDTGKDGDFFTFDNAGKYTGANGDVYASVASGSGNLTVSGSSTITPLSAGWRSVPAGTTLAQLKSGTVAGIDSNTLVAIWVGVDVSSGGSASATINSVSIN